MGNGITDARRRGGTIPAAFRTAFPLTVPIAAGFLFLGCSYGLLMHAKGFAFWYPVAMAYFIFAGSMEFVTVNLLLSAFAPLAAFLLTLMVNARHLFYGLSMLDRFRGLGWKKPYLIFAMCDESFAINSGARIPQDVDRGWFMMFVSLLNRWYWIIGTALGWLIGGLLPFSTKGIEFVLTALFLTILLGQWDEVDETDVPHDDRGHDRPSAALRALRRHAPALVGVLASLACLVVLGPDRFMIPSLALMLVLFLALRPWLDDGRDGDAAGAAGDGRDGNDGRDATNGEETAR
ncbi:AzlC family ABC transporter permease [Bifidobacterium saguinibicoloris]|uniref:AzlC family ABC transporter permease n=1 Tax=Bifidobacterium saguinibicoloris TaxID=2834433 RepID=UPI001C59BEC6|nr:AzlC family ABC transporter permease [Bifidobacterium saguinibicoloris]MBW3080495.1 AzlC family ABC transporter permease [Bifidobacterium saguinibicoloris]